MMAKDYVKKQEQRLPLNGEVASSLYQNDEKDLLKHDTSDLVNDSPNYEELRPLILWPDWISLDDAIPCSDTEVLLTDGESKFIAKVIRVNNVNFVSVPHKNIPTHWMHLPELPK